MNIKCLYYCRYSTSNPIHVVNQETSNKALANDIDKMSLKIKSIRAKINDRDKLRTSYGVWYVTRDNYDVAYAVCANESYPERVAYGLIAKIQEKIGEINDAEYEAEENIKAQTKGFANQMAKKYNDLSKVDKLSKAQDEVDSLKGEIGNGIQKMVGNQQSLNNMSQKAQKMKHHAMEFQRNSDKLEKLLYWRNCKIKIIVALCIIGLVGFIILIIVQRSNSDDTKKL